MSYKPNTGDTFYIRCFPVGTRVRIAASGTTGTITAHGKRGNPHLVYLQRDSDGRETSVLRNDYATVLEPATPATSERS